MTSTTILISNMTCDGCAKGVLAMLKAAAPDAHAEVDVAARRLTLHGGDAAALVASLRADGWEAAEAAS